MKRVALVGASGYIGSALFNRLQKDTSLAVQPVTRSSYFYWKKQKFDIVINAAMPSARFWAEQNPHKDFTETVKKTADIVYGWKYKKIIQISSVSARSELDSIYGRHKAAAETLCEFGDNLLVRLTAVYADTLKKGALVDMVKGNKVYVSGKSSYAFASLEFVCDWITRSIDKKGLIEVGARNTISLEEIARHFNLRVVFEGRVDVQQIQNPSPDYPDARDVLQFLSEKLHR